VVCPAPRFTMPFYDYLDHQRNTVSRCVPVAERDKQIGLQRITVSPFSFPGHAVSPLDQKEGLRQGYYREECKQGSRFRSSYSKNTIRRVWGI
jgi:hypothetical protein